MQKNVYPISNRYSLRSFSLIELLVVLAIIAILSALIIPTVGKGLERSRRANCASQLRHLHVGLLSYADVHNDHLPEHDSGSGHWTHQIYDAYLQDESLLLCPSEMRSKNPVFIGQIQNGPPTTYGYWGGKTRGAQNPEDDPGYRAGDDPNAWVMCDYQWSTSHKDGKNVLFYDGHVAFVPLSLVKCNTGEALNPCVP